MRNTKEKLVELLDDKCLHKDGTTLFDVADHLISHGVTFSSWIPVVDKLPEPLVDVLVYDHTAGRVEIGFITSHFEWVGVCMSHEVTHWMPIPEHPSVTDKTDR